MSISIPINLYIRGSTGRMRTYMFVGTLYVSCLQDTRGFPTWSETIEGTTCTLNGLYNARTGEKIDDSRQVSEIPVNLFTEYEDCRKRGALVITGQPPVK